MDEFDDSLRQWIPPENVLAHNGDPLPEDRDFFAEPPEEIGEVQTAWSTMKDGKAPWGIGMRLLLGGIFGLLSMIAFIVLFHFLLNGALGLSIVISVVASVVVVGATLWGTGFRHTCSYTGTAGIARLVCKGDRQNVTTDLLFLFEEAAELRTSQTVHYTNGIYTGTAYEFVWSTGSQERVQKISGTYHNQKGLPAAKDPYCFAHAAEIAWSQQCLDHAQEELERQGAIAFRLKGKDRVRVGPGFIELIQGGKCDRLEADDVKEVSLDQGVFTVKRVGAKSGFLGIGKSGIFTFNYSQMANARVFLLSLDALMGLKFS